MQKSAKTYFSGLYLDDKTIIQQSEKLSPRSFVVLLNDIRAVSRCPLPKNRDRGARQKPNIFDFGEIEAKVAERVNWIPDDININSTRPTVSLHIYHSGSTYLHVCFIYEDFECVQKRNFVIFFLGSTVGVTITALNKSLCPY